METIPGSGNWKLTIRREAAGITILRAATCDARAAPAGDVIRPAGDGPGGPRPLAHRRFRGGGGAAGDLRHRDGPGDLEQPGPGGPDPAPVPGAGGGLRPDELRRPADPAASRRHRSVGRRRADELPTAWTAFHLTRVGEQGDTLAWFADELPWELDVTVGGDGRRAVFRLIFPEYREVYEENCPAHHFDYNIYGAGYPYHHCFRQKQLDLRTYDELWQRLSGHGARRRTARCGWPSGGCATRRS